MSLPFVGADAFARFLCADKALAKNIIGSAGLVTAAYLRIDTIEDLNKECQLSFPVVVKPNNEDSSVGITQHSICYNWQDARSLAASLLRDFEGSVLIEEFASGKEVYVCVLKEVDGSLSIAFAERQVDGDPDYFKENLFTGSIKRLKTKSTHMLPCSSAHLDSIKSCFADVFNRIGSLVSLRIDGRLSNDKFIVLELTTSPNLNETAEYLSAFKIDGRSPESVIKSMIHNEWKRHLITRGG
jgi:D-alanine-D-alanine ligase